MTFTPLSDLLPEAAGKNNFSRQMLAAQVCEKYRKIVLKKIGSDALAHTWPKWFKNMILTIGVEDSAWSQEIQMNKEKILKEINIQLKRKVVAQIKIMIDQREY
ncbi:MAG: hypothetical protein UR27_C0021G0041 [Candidatus Peregrinibacteria bacterium GW2011_GWA2_33_10]|nr:MAG: hypothetical protein UR27_C0021G0041 [Candidatus Peregrinibacteria bacterium GW2011_GWA2_33_10]KKP40976.1 MAG: hypothetical protein UR30_C0002G0010 [Candidatus Peregrinibacteria bacterium GW2011_GWC2_33_13]